MNLINEAVAKHRALADQSDDITVLAMTYRGFDSAAVDLKVTIPADLDAIDSVLERFEAFASAHALDDTVRRQVLLVLDDLINNVASYAYGHDGSTGDESQAIEIHANLTPKRLVLTISDNGAPFNPFGLNAPDVQASLEERDVGGLGIHLVRTVMDDVDYTRRAGRNVVTVMKDLEPETATDPEEGMD